MECGYKKIKAYYKKLHDKGLLGDPNLSASKLKTTVNLEGVEEVIAESAEKDQSQNDFVYNALLRHIDYLEELLADEKMKVPAEVSLKMALGNITPEKGDEKILRAQVLNLAMENSGFLNEFNRLASEIVKTRAALEEIYSKNPHGDSEAEKKDHAEKLKSNETVKQLTEKLKQLRKRRDDILAGKYATNTNGSETETGVNGSTSSTSKTTETWTHHEQGNKGVLDSYQKMVIQFREAISAADTRIIEKLNDLFLGIY